MARELNIRVTADTTDAVQNLKATETAVQGVSGAADDMNTRWAASAKASDEAVKTANEKWNASPLSKPDGPIAKTTSNVTDLIGGLQKIAVAFGLEQLVSKTIEFGSHLEDLSAKSGITVEALQNLNYAGVTVGLSLDAMVSGVDMFQRRLAEGDKSAVAAVGKLGLSVDALKAMQPDQAFLTIAEAISTIPGQGDKLATAYDLMGRQGEKLVPLLLNVDALKEKHATMSKEAVAGLDWLDDHWSTLKTDVLSEIGSLIGGIVAMDFKGLFKLMAPQTYLAVQGWEAWAKAAVGYAEQVYTGVKLWMVDKFDSIVKAVKGKIDAVTGFFGDMYDKVVGHSYVPDMINEIKLSFDLLKPHMVEPAKTATGTVTKSFADMGTLALNSVDGFLTALSGPNRMGGLKKTATGFATDFVSGFMDVFAPGMTGEAKGEVMGAVNQFISVLSGPNKLGGLKALASQFAEGFVAGFLDVMVPGLGQLVEVAWPLIQKGLDRIGQGIKSFFSGIGHFFAGLFGGGSTGEGQDPNQPIYSNPSNGAIPGTGYYNGGGDYVPTPEEANSDEWRANHPGYAEGTRGRYIDFGAGTAVTLHGKERVMTEAEGRAAGGSSLVVQVLVPDGRVLAETAIPYWNDATRRLGFAT